MKELIPKFIDMIISLFKNNYRKPKLWIAIAIVFLVLVLLGPYIYSTLFYYGNMEKRIDILKQLIELDTELISENVEFIEEYNSLIYDMSQQRERSLLSLTERVGRNLSDFFEIEYKESNNILKFVSGAFWLILLTICIPFMNTFKKRSDKVLAFILVLIAAILLGMLCACIPTIITPYVNYFGIPILEMAVLIVIVAKSNNNSKKCKA